jgi:hypothetical protein
VEPPPLTHVVLADQHEIANGYATPVPYDTIVLYPAWPPGSEYDFEDWLRLAFSHEFTHIVHLDRSEGWARIARRVVGRAPYAFPNVFLPTWEIEGLATFEESAITGEGRLHAGEFRAIVGEAARARVLEPLDRVNGGLTDWPGGTAPYVYGVGFHEYLVSRFGADSLGDLASATARRFPYASTRAFRYVYGEPLGALWREYEASLEATIAPAAPLDSGLRRLTHHGFTVGGPRFDRFACDACPLQILYSVRDPRRFPTLYRLALDGTPPRPLTTRYWGSTLGIGGGAIYFDQLEARRNVGFYADLYEFSRADGSVRQLTSNARLQDPDLSPDGATLVATQNRFGQRDLVMVRLRDEVTPLVSEPDVYFDTPRWSPDGRTIAAARHRLGEMPELVVVDVAATSLRVVAADPQTRFAMPAWRPDGATLVVAAAHGDEPFNLFEVALDGSPIRQLTHTTGGAWWPDVSPDGRTIVFAGYTPQGYDVFSMPYPENVRLRSPEIGASVGEARRRVSRAPAARSEPGVVPTTDYSPLATLAPTSWSPVIESDGETVRVGAAIAGVDVLGYHRYAATASWLVSTPENAITPAPSRPDWQIYYAYDRWRPTLYAAAGSATSFFAGPPTAAGTASATTRRETTVEGGIYLPILHARNSHAALLSIAHAADEFTLGTGSFARDRTPLRAAWETITARTYGYSVSREHGIAAGATAEAVRRGLGSDADATTVTGDVRGYLPGIAPHHVIALRLSGGSSAGDVTVGRTFLLGGARSAASVVDFGARASSLLRGFPDATFAGSRVALLNAEYRWPIARPQRGVGTWPLFLHTVHASLFADAGEAWTRTFRSDLLKTSVGGEVSADIVAGYFAPLTLAAGAAWGHDRAGAFADRATAYFRVGKAF